MPRLDGHRQPPWHRDRRGRVPGAPGDGWRTAGRHARASRARSASIRRKISARWEMAAPSSRTTRALAERLRRLRNGGQIDRYLHEEFGVNSRLDEMQAAVLRARLPFLREWTERRRALARRYRAALGGAPVRVHAGARPGPRVSPVYRCASPARDASDAPPRAAGHRHDRALPDPAAAPAGVRGRPRSGVPAGRQPETPVADRLCAEVCSLPLHPGLTDADDRPRRLGSERLATGASVRTGTALMFQTVIASLLVAYLPGALAYRVPFGERPLRAALAAEERAFWAVVLSVVLVARGRHGAGGSRSVPVPSPADRERRAVQRPAAPACRTKLVYGGTAPRVGLRRCDSRGPHRDRRAALFSFRRVRHRRKGPRHVHQRGRADRAARQS